MILVVGGRGLTGSAIVRELRRRGLEHDIVQRENRRAFHGRSCDVLIFCAGNAFKWKATEDPHYDLVASVAHLSYYVHEVRARTFVMMSDVEVYGDPSSVEATREDVPRLETTRSTYGYHKLLAEEVVRRFEPDHLILRLPTLVGAGLRKNAIHDVICGERAVRIARSSRLNVLHTDQLAMHVLELLETTARGTFNLGAPDSVSLGEVVELFGRDPVFRPGAENMVKHQEISVERVAAHLELESSLDAVRRFREEVVRRSAAAAPGQD